MILLIQTKKISRQAALGLLGVSLLIAPCSQAGFEWITPVDAGAIAKQPPLPEMQPVAPKKELPAPLQLPTETEKPAVFEAEPGMAPAVGESEMPDPVILVPPSGGRPVVEPSPEIRGERQGIPALVPVSAGELAAVSANHVAADGGRLLTELDPGQSIEGFGKAIPLILALKQTLPAGHIFAFEEGVDPATPVDWQGGRGWRVVLAESLRGAGLVGRESGDKVSILKATEANVAAAGAVRTDREPPLSMVAMAPIAEMPAAAPEPVVSLPSDREVIPAPTEIQPLQAAPVAPEEPAKVADKVPDNIIAPPLPLAAVDPKLELPTAAEPPVSMAEPQPAATGDAAGDRVVKGMVVMPHAALEPPLLPGASDVWRAESGESLRNVIKRWASRANVDLVWSTEYDFPIQAGVSLSGSFEEAVRDLLSGFVDAKPQPFGRLHDNPSVGQRTLVVQTRGNTGAE